MTLKEELEILRGEPIQVFAGDPMDIPCIETSDPEKLCKHPVVSVNMITYNHEPYIRQAIEGVMMQKTDFEFELVIGEDCSTDKTREICFEYQKRYPDKIRVLWCDHNLYRNPHPAGGNSARNKVHCRGEFIAFCEGDDYWTDPLKLQKQVDLIRVTNSVMCVSCAEWQYPNGEKRVDRRSDIKTTVPLDYIVCHYFHTSTLVVDKEALKRCYGRYQGIICWYDTVMEICVAAEGPVCYLSDKVSVYRWTGKGVSGNPNSLKHRLLTASHFMQLMQCGPDQLRSKAAKQLIECLSGGLYGVNDTYLGLDIVQKRLLKSVYRKAFKILYGQKWLCRYLKERMRHSLISVYAKQPILQKINHGLHAMKK